MDSAPLNMAHFHERRADKYLKHHRYDEANKAIETSLMYLQDAYQKVTLAKSIEVLNTQKWDYLRKLSQIQMRKQQYERLKHKDSSAAVAAPLCDTVNASQMRTDSAVSAQSAAKSIDKTVKDFDMKFTSLLEHGLMLNNKENREPPKRLQSVEPATTTRVPSTSPPKQQQLLQQQQQQQPQQQRQQQTQAQHENRQSPKESDMECCVYDFEDNDEMPSLAPLELPAFDFTVLTASVPSLASITDLAENLQK